LRKLFPHWRLYAEKDGEEVVCETLSATNDNG
jgi:hypothetical protein